MSVYALTLLPLGREHRRLDRVRREWHDRSINRRFNDVKAAPGTYEAMRGLVRYLRYRRSRIRRSKDGEQASRFASR